MPVSASSMHAARTRSVTSDSLPAHNTASRRAPEMEFGLDYHVKQYGTDTLVGGGAIAAGVFIFAPEPVVTKIIGGSIALSCIVAGGGGKHLMYRGAYIHEALEKAMNKLDGQVETLDTEIKILEATSKSLKLTNERLARTRDVFSRQVEALQNQIGRLDSNVGEAFSQLNRDRQAFEDEKTAKLAQLTDEILEADARGNRAQLKLERLDEKEAVLSNLAGELNGRREKLAEAEAELRNMQARLLEVCANEPDLMNRLAVSTGPSLVPERPVSVPESSAGSEESGTQREPTQEQVKNLKALMSLTENKGAKVYVDPEGHFDIQRAGFFSQSVPRSFQSGASVSSRSHFFRPVFKFFHDGKQTFTAAELQLALEGVATMRATYADNRVKHRTICELLDVIVADNPKLQMPSAGDV